MPTPEVPRGKRLSEEVKRPKTASEFRKIIDAYQKSIGNPLKFQEDMTLEEYYRPIKETILGEFQPEDFHSIKRYNMRIWKIKTLQEAAILREEDKALLDIEEPEILRLLPRGFNRAEYIFANQMRTYDKAFSEIAQYYADVLGRHNELLEIISSLPKEDKKKCTEMLEQSFQFMKELHLVIDERVALGNIYEIDSQLISLEGLAEDIRSDLKRLPEGTEIYLRKMNGLKEVQNKKKNLLKLRRKNLDKITKLPLEGNETIGVLSSFNKAAGMLEKGDFPSVELRKLHSHFRSNVEQRVGALDRRFIEIARGEGIKGVPDGFTPVKLYSEIIRARYDQILKQQKENVYKNAQFKEGGSESMKNLDKQRRSILAERLAYTHELTMYQMRLTSLGVMQSMLEDLNTEGALKGDNFNPERVTIHTKESRKDAMEKLGKMKEYHISKLENIIDTAEKNFSEDWYTYFHDGVKKGTLKSTDVGIVIGCILMDLEIPFTDMKVPLAGTLGKKVHEIVEPLAESFGWPRDENGVFIPLDEIKDKDPDKHAEIVGKLLTLAKVMKEFRENNNSNEIKDTLNVIRALDITKSVDLDTIGRVNGEIVEKEREIISSSNLEAKLQEYQKLINPASPKAAREDAIATMHVVLLNQLGTQWGTVSFSSTGPEPGDFEISSGSGFIGAYAKMLHGIEGVIEQDIGVAEKCKEVGANLWAVAEAGAYGLTAVIVLAPLAPAIGYGAGVATAKVPKVARWMFGKRQPPIASPKSGPSVSPMQRAVAGGVLAYELYDMYQHIEELGEKNEMIKETKGKIIADLALLGFEEIGDNRYEHSNGAIIRLDDIENPLNYQRYIQYGKISADIGQAGAMLLVMSGLKYAGPVGWTVYGVLLIVEKGLEDYEEQKAHEFFANCPPYLCVLLGANSLKRTEHGLLETASNPALIKDASEEVKQNVRDKMWFNIFCHEIGSVDPEMLMEVSGGKYNVDKKTEFYNGDFNDVLKKFALMRIYKNEKESGGDMSKEDIFEGRVEESTWWGLAVFESPEITHMEIRSALREGCVLCAKAHNPEKQYIQVLLEREKIKKIIDRDGVDSTLLNKLRDLNYLVGILGDQIVMGGVLNEEITLDVIKRNNGKTRAQMIIEIIMKTNNFKVSKGTIAGLPRDIDFSTNSDLYKMLLSNEGDRQKMEKIGPLIVEEPEGSDDPLWYHNYLKPVLGANPTAKSIKSYHRRMRVSAANAVIGSINEDNQLAENTSQFAAEDAITRYASKIISDKRGYAPEFIEGGHTYRTGEKDPSFAFTSKTSRHPYPSEVELGDIGEKDEYHPDKIIGRFREQHKLGRNELVDLTTYVFGDPRDIKKMYVVQKAMVEADLLHVEAGFYGLSTSDLRKMAAEQGRDTRSRIFGRPLVMSAEDFIKQQPGGKKMFSLLLPKHEEHRIMLQETERKRVEAARPEMEKERIQQKRAKANAKKNPKVWHEYSNNVTARLEGTYDQHYVAYMPMSIKGDRGVFIYLREPRIWSEGSGRKGHSTIGPSTDIPEVVHGDRMWTRITVEEEGKEQSRYHIGPQFMNEAKSGIHQNAIRHGLTLPIPGKPRDTILKTIAPYVYDVDSKGTGAIVMGLTQLYERYAKNNAQKTYFLRRLQNQMHWASTGESRKESKWLDKEKKKYKGVYDNLRELVYSADFREHGE